MESTVNLLNRILVPLITNLGLLFLLGIVYSLPDYYTIAH